MLTHYLKDLNTHEIQNVPEGVKMVFQGHSHFKNENAFVYTVRGAGIGYDSSERKKASYVILTENPEGGFIIEEKNIEFDYEHTGHDINDSSMSDEDKHKIESWVGVRKR